MGCDIHMYVECRHPPPQQIAEAIIEAGSRIHPILTSIKPLVTLIAEYGETTDWLLCSETDEDVSDVRGMLDRGVKLEEFRALRIAPEFGFFRVQYYSRHYEFFGCLAGVRSVTAPPIVEPRDVPSDMSEALRWIWKDWEGARHTDTWLTLNEVDPECNTEYWNVKTNNGQTRAQRCLDGHFVGWLRKLRAYQQTNRIADDRIRLVFWFDS